MANNILPFYGYNDKEIDIISDIIACTSGDKKPETLLQKIMCDADHDYLGRADYYHVAKKLRLE